MTVYKDRLFQEWSVIHADEYIIDDYNHQRYETS